MEPFIPPQWMLLLGFIQLGGKTDMASASQMATELFGVNIPVATAYSLLRSLQIQRLISEVHGEFRKTSERGRAARVFQVTDAGRTHMASAAATYARAVSALLATPPKSP